MGYITDYIGLIKDKSFDEIPFTEVDGAIFSIMSLIDVNECIPTMEKHETKTLQEVASRHIKLHGFKPLGLLISSAMVRMMNTLKDTSRYKDLIFTDLYNRINIEEATQSTFFSVILPNGTRVVVNGGTDDTIVGWKEDFNLMNDGHAPCLKYAKDYLNKVGRISDKLIVVGHSKGGFEALYAGAFCRKSVYNKIERIISYDGPGYSEDIIHDEQFIKAMEKMTLIVPNCSVVGRLFNNPVEPKILKSKYHGLNQHDPLSWETEDFGFKYGKKFTKESNALKDKIDQVCIENQGENGIEFVHDLFSVFEAGGSLTLTDIGNKPHKALIAYLKLPKDKRTLITRLLLMLVNDKIIAKELILGAITIPSTK